MSVRSQIADCSVESRAALTYRLMSREPTPWMQACARRVTSEIGDSQGCHILPLLFAQPADAEKEWRRFIPLSTLAFGRKVRSVDSVWDHNQVTCSPAEDRSPHLTEGPILYEPLPMQWKRSETHNLDLKGVF